MGALAHLLDGTIAGTPTRKKTGEEDRHPPLPSMHVPKKALVLDLPRPLVAPHLPSTLIELAWLGPHLDRLSTERLADLTTRGQQLVLPLAVLALQYHLLLRLAATEMIDVMIHHLPQPVLT